MKAYKDYEGVKFPSQIEIWRPQEEYDITLTIVKLQLNEPLADDKFALEQPAGAQVVHLDHPQSSLVNADGREVSVEHSAFSIASSRAVVQNAECKPAARR